MSEKKKADEIKAYMGPDTVFNGSLSFEGTVRIDGKFEGEVVTDDTLIIGETGELSADVKVGTIICQGKIKGTIVAAHKVEMHASSCVVGNVKTPALYMELGAKLDGNCDMSGKEAKIVKLPQSGTDEKPAAAQG